MAAHAPGRAAPWSESASLDSLIGLEACSRRAAPQSRPGKSERAILKQTGHKSLPMVRRYIREGSLFRDNATDGLPL